MYYICASLFVGERECNTSKASVGLMWVAQGGGCHLSPTRIMSPTLRGVGWAGTTLEVSSPFLQIMSEENLKI